MQRSTARWPSASGSVAASASVVGIHPEYLDIQWFVRQLTPSIGRVIVTPRETLRRHDDKNNAHARPVRDPTAVYSGARPPGRGAGGHRHRAALDPQLV